MKQRNKQDVAERIFAEMYCLRMSGATLKQIGAMYGKHHSTVIHGLRKVNDLLSIGDERIKNYINDYKMVSKKIIAIDFDGTIVEDRYPEIGRLKPGAKEYILQLKKDGFKLILWTSRTGLPLARAVEFLTKEGITFDEINNSCKDNVNEFGNDTRKIFADVYVDDKCVMMRPFPRWSDIYDMIHRWCPPTYGDLVGRDGQL